MAFMGADTSAVGGPRYFPTTMWSNVLAAGNPSLPQHRDCLNKLMTEYWKPVFIFIRTAWRKPAEDAKDLTQAFFAQLLERGFLARAQHDRGSFRGYLKQALRYFLIDADRAASSRRPAKPIFSLDVDDRELDRLGPAAPDEPPERAYDREWFRCLMESSVEALRKFLEAEGKTVYFEIFRASCLESPDLSAPSRPPTYRAMGERWGLNERDVGNYLTYCRKIMRQIVRERIRDYVETDGDVDPEIELFLRG